MENMERITLIENALGVEKAKNITYEQIQAAYALNLCSVSVSQIIDYNDINILEQEYENILNNLNLENMPKDEALLDIIKRLLETITFFRIQEGDKEFIEKDYQYKMRNAIWSAMPNPGALISAGLSQGAVGLAFSLAASVGTAYMNYRKSKAEFQTEKEKQYWELKKTAMEQFQALQQQLFETSWRLADKYEFPDILRLSERQIKQYNKILMDQDEIRKFERLDSIKHKFAAYPPFWYYFGNTANSIAMSEHYGLDEKGKEIYRNHARNCFEYFSLINKYDLLREDGITASCYLEYADLLDTKKDVEKISELIKKAVSSAGNSLDILQLCAIAYMKIGESDKAANILRQLVNEQYNEVTNAQLLSTIYVNKYIELQSDEAKTAYKILGTRVNPDYLFPLPDNLTNIDKELLQKNFIKTQRSILKIKYTRIMEDFVRKYEAKINSIIPLPEDLEHCVPEEIYADKKSAREERINRVKLGLYGKNKSEYISTVQEILYSYEVLKILNEMFDSICLLECVQDQHKQLEFQQIIKQGIQSCKEKLQNADSRLTNFDECVYEEIQKLTLKDFTKNFFRTIALEMNSSVNAKTDMNDFAIAEFNLADFCRQEGFEEPEVIFAHIDDAEIKDTITIYFTPDLIGESTIKQNERIQKNKAMIDTIRESIEEIVCSDEIEFFTQEDQRMKRYFYGRPFNDPKYNNVKNKTLAVLDDRSKGDMDLLFTTEGVMPIIKGKGKATVSYSEIEWSNNGKKKELIISGKYANEKIDMDKLYELINKLAENEDKNKEDN